MKIILTEEQIKKILSTISLEELEQKLEANYEYWLVDKKGIDTFNLSKKEKE